MNTLESLRDDLHSVEIILNQRLREYGYTLNELYRSPSSISVPALISCGELLDDLESILEAIFKIKYNHLENVKFLKGLSLIKCKF